MAFAEKCMGCVFVVYLSVLHLVALPQVFFSSHVFCLPRLFLCPLLMNSTCLKCCLPSSCILVHLHRYLHTGSVNVGMTYDLIAFSLFGLILEYSLTLYQSVFHAATASLLTSLDCIENDFFHRSNLTSLLYLPALLQFACKFLFGSSD